ncbi:acyl-CoA synthetase [Saccharopolyspora spinosa]|uniref:Acyl-CoA synthetase (AMP-forming)/AMP-acid ligase II n=1 Tax=Saccharopolyspora spinosa TaxID=60894 RepID=A0A2N3XY84_SACSN|nr:acyl-CoA synthetase [Saccharopolyspora spinosa]PKW15612.1 acyl-CoA synthetase (AMP-forming)/AMP-acid ligase II [Saccharopolyspora spinosa]
MAYNIADLFEHAVDLVPDRVAVVCGERRLTFAQLDQRANRLAHHLTARGLGPGSHIGVYSRNSVEALETMLAAYKVRAVPININFRYVPNELRYIFDDADLAALVHERRYSDHVAKVRPDFPQLREVLVIEDGTDADCTGYGGVEYESALTGQSAERDFPERSADDLYLLYTGGTTGMPKGVMWRHEDVWRVLGGGIDFMTGEAMRDEWQQARTGAESGGLIWLAAAPFIHGAAQWASFGNLFACSTVVFVPQFDAHEVWRTIERERVDVLAIVGDAMARPLIEALHEGGYDASSLVVISSSAALFSPSVQRQYLDALPNVMITDSIGSSETGFSGIGVIGRDNAQTGGPRVNADAFTTVIRDDGSFALPGEIGWLARTGNLPLGYYKDEEKSRSVFREIDGKRYVAPGDYARIEDDGTVTMLGRGSVSINTGGEKVFPDEVEAALKSHPDVFDALVVGVPDERLGQRVAAVVQPRAGSTPGLADLDAHVREWIAGYKVPRSLWLVDEVTRSPSGKPDYAWAKRHTETHEPTDVREPSRRETAAEPG